MGVTESEDGGGGWGLQRAGEDFISSSISDSDHRPQCAASREPTMLRHCKGARKTPGELMAPTPPSSVCTGKLVCVYLLMEGRGLKIAVPSQNEVIHRNKNPCAASLPATAALLWGCSSADSSVLGTVCGQRGALR